MILVHSKMQTRRFTERENLNIETCFNLETFKKIIAVVPKVSNTKSINLW